MAEKGPELILAGDVGGTKTYLGVFALKGDRLRLVRAERFLNDRFSGFEDVLGFFLEMMAPGRIASASFGIAGPVGGERCALTNIPWVIDADDIRKRFGIKKVTFINDLKAAALGVDVLGGDDLFILQRGAPAKGNAALIAAGTGLGEAILFWDGTGHIPSASEGGHADFAPRTPLEIELLGYLAGLFGHVSYERVLSGQGLVNIYHFLKERRVAKESMRLKKRFIVEDAAEVITDEALGSKDALCKEALSVFMSVYGAEAGNLALKAMAQGGVYVGGGIAPRILKAFQNNIFLNAFSKKGRFEKLLKQIPVYVILNEKTALYGAACAAAAVLSRGRLKKKITRIVR